MKFKKIVSLATCVATVSTMLVGCGSNSGNSSTATSGGKDEKPTELVWYCIGNEPNDLTDVQAKINEYLLEKMNATVNMKFSGFGDYSQKISMVINSGEDYDIAFTCSWACDYIGNARKGAFLDLSEYLDTTLKETYEAVDKRFWDGAEIDGKIYAVPTQKEIAAAPMWRFTKEYVDKYNIPYEDIHSLEDLEPWLKLIKENEPDVVPLYIAKGTRTPQLFDEIVEPVGVAFDDESLTVKNLYETDFLKSQLEIMRRFFELGYINGDAATTDGDESVKRFVDKADGQPYADRLWSENLKYEVVTSNVTDAYITNGSTTGSMMAVSANSKNKEKAIEFLNLLNTDEYLKNLVVYGIEGVHYEKVGDKTIKYTEKHADYDVAHFAFGNLFINYVLEGEPETKWDDFQKFNDESIASEALGFKFDISNVTNELAAISNVLSEFKFALYSGSVDIDEYLDKMNTKLKEQGLQKVIDEMQTQIDAWKAEN